MIPSFRRPFAYPPLLSHRIPAQTGGKAVAPLLPVGRGLDAAKNPNGQRRAVGVETDAVLSRPAAAERCRLNRKVRFARGGIGGGEVGQGIALGDQAQLLAVKLELVGSSEFNQPTLGNRAVAGEFNRVVLDVRLCQNRLAAARIRPNVVPCLLRERLGRAYQQIAADQGG